ncbi:MAG: hypothetical protein ABIH66_08215, partial [bacterium]
NPIKSTALGDDDVLIKLIAPPAPNTTDSQSFNTRGEPTPSGGVTIEVKDSGDRWIWHVSVESTTGQALLTEIQ